MLAAIERDLATDEGPWPYVSCIEVTADISCFDQIKSNEMEWINFISVFIFTSDDSQLIEHSHIDSVSTGRNAVKRLPEKSDCIVQKSLCIIAID